MIRVDVPFDKCQMCQHFTASTRFNKQYANSELIALDTIISCSNQDLCNMLYTEAKKDLASTSQEVLS